jgi:hypothetical protein
MALALAWHQGWRLPPWRGALAVDVESALAASGPA